MEKEGTAVASTTTTQFQDCTVPPVSMNGASFLAGCAGAVWSDGVYSRTYCEGASGKYPWWGACCTWDGLSSACLPKHAASGDRRLTTLSGNISQVIVV